MNWHWVFQHVFPGPFLRRYFRVHMVGLENLPAAGPYILAIGSHTTELESPILAVNLPRHYLHFFAKAEYWTDDKHPLRGRLKAWFMDNSGQIPLSRTDSRAALEAIDKGVDILREGGILAIYPEGTRSRDGRLHKGHTGAARMAIRADACIIPVGLIGMEKINPPGGKVRRGMATIVIGEPIDPRRYKALAKRPGVSSHRMVELPLARLVTDAVMKEIARLSIKHYSSKYLEISNHQPPSP